ncbi:hypothetical protein Hs20B_15740 [Lactococcus insecticola]|uniref:histidine kinase n=1 Tax=Pseudolactococcus insecticola TaxID=2709158 RepID=A0A6A0B8L0_9LACT|nr:hypothetical protein Hs20B_15740 [Lactococcus insecticola]
MQVILLSMGQVAYIIYEIFVRLSNVLLIEAQLLTLWVIVFYWSRYYTSLLEKKQLKDAYAELEISYHQVEHLSARVERGKIAREFHDTVLQDVIAVTMQLENITTLLKDQQPQAALTLSEHALVLSHEATVNGRKALSSLRDETEKRTLSFNERLVILKQIFEEDFQLTLQINGRPDKIDLAPGTINEVIKMVSEALRNVVKHTGTSVAIMNVIPQGENVAISIIDFGDGFDETEQNKSNHFGLKGMNERAAKIGGSVTVDSVIGEGTTVKVIAPTK